MKRSHFVLLALALTVGSIIFFATKTKTMQKEPAHSFVMPGPLIIAHKELEARCEACHTPFKKGGQSDLCLNCHKDVKADLAGGLGFHGQNPQVKERQCSACHTDHKGREFDTVHMDKETFDHRWTDFPLTGAHATAGVACESCHAPGKKFREAVHDCFGCHAAADRHQGKLGQDCARCHNPASWSQTFFDHEKTHFPLQGKHRETACDACHANESFTGTPTKCASCHSINDIHHQPDADCSRCHNTEGWKKISFDHNLATKFELKDKHAAAACVSCHEGNQFQKNSGTACADCHKAEDVHRGRNGLQCASCHATSGWKQVHFDHDKDTRFKLVGAHRAAQCISCHKDTSGRTKISAECISCHKADDVHKGQQGEKCQTCHNESGWKEKIRFDHDMTHFPLIGLHAVASCGACHTSTTFKDTKSDCISCHRVEDKHHGALGVDCAKCHNPNAWGRWEFNHDTQTRYKLEGAHQDLLCETCHRASQGRSATLSSACIACHEQDDPHSGRFGQLCEQCHTVESFKKIKVR